MRSVTMIPVQTIRSATLIKVAGVLAGALAIGLLAQWFTPNLCNLHQIPTSEQNAPTSEQNAPASEQNAQPAADNKRVKELLACLFEQVLKGLNIVRENGQYEPPSSFIIYAHDDRKNPTNGDAGARVVRELIKCFESAGSRTRSDRLPVLPLTTTTAEDREAGRDILLNQFCLLPEKLARNPVDVVIIVASEVLFGHCDDTHGKKYMEALRQTILLPGLKKDEVEGKIRKIVDQYQPGIHHVLTEIAMVATRIEMDANPLSIVPVMHQGAKLEDLRKILPKITNTRHYHRPRKSETLDPEAQSLHRLFFNLLIDDLCNQHDEKRKYLYVMLKNLYDTGVKKLEKNEETQILPPADFQRILNSEMFEEIHRESRRQPLDLRNRYPESLSKSTKQGAEFELHDPPTARDSLRPFEPLPKPTAKLSRKQREYLKWLAFPNMHLQAEELTLDADKTLEWVQYHRSYQKWMQEQSDILGVFGKPGSGKSTVLRSIVSRSQNKLKSTDELDPLFLYFFFKGRGRFVEGSRIGMFSALLHQLLAEIPMAGQDFWVWMEEEATSVQLCVKEVEHLRSWFISALAIASAFHRIVIVVDAIDEADDGGDTETARDVLADLRFINRHITSIETADVRICFSCRYQPTIVVDNGHEIRVDECNQDAMRTYVKTEITRHIGIDPTANEYHEARIQEIVEKSGGIFLWVILCVKELIRRGWFLSGLRFRNVTEMHMQGEMSLKYDEIIRKHRDSDEFIILADWITSSFRPLSLEELRHAIACDDKYMDPAPSSSQSSQGFQKDDVDLSREIRRLFSGLVEVKELSGLSIAQFIHWTIREYFQNTELLDKLDSKSECQTLRDRQVARSHHRLGLCCLNFIRIESSRWEDLTPDELESIPFCRYAVEYWPRHAERADRFDVQPGKMAQLLSPLLDDGDKQTFLRWVKAYRAFHPDKLPAKPSARDVAQHFRIFLPKSTIVATGSELAGAASEQE